jgi:hypothetical protein
MTTGEVTSAARQCGLGPRVAVVLGRDLGQHAGDDDAGRRRATVDLQYHTDYHDGSGDRLRSGVHLDQTGTIDDGSGLVSGIGGRTA